MVVMIMQRSTLTAYGYKPRVLPHIAELSPYILIVVACVVFMIFHLFNASTMIGMGLEDEMGRIVATATSIILMFNGVGFLVEKTLC